MASSLYGGLAPPRLPLSPAQAAAARTLSSPKSPSSPLSPQSLLSQSAISQFLIFNTDPIDKAKVIELSNFYRLNKGDVISRLARYVLDQFGILYEPHPRKAFGAKELKDEYDKQFNTVIQTSALITQGRIEELKNGILGSARALGAKYTPEELVNQRINFCLEHLPMPVQRAKEWQIRYQISFSDAYLKHLEAKQQRLADLLYRFIDSAEVIELTPELATELEIFIFSDTPIEQDDSWATEIKCWAKENTIDKQRLRRIETIMELERLSGEKPLTPHPRGREISKKEKDRILIEQQRREIGEVSFSPPIQRRYLYTPEMLGSSSSSISPSQRARGVISAASAVEEKAEAPVPSFREYVFTKTLNTLSKKLGILLSDMLRTSLAESYRLEANRKRDLFFLDIPEFLTLPLSQEMHFLRAAQKFLQCEQKSGEKMPLLFEWAFTAPPQVLNSFSSDREWKGYTTAAFIFEHVEIDPKRKLEILKCISQLPDIPVFELFIREVIQTKVFPLDTSFFLEMKFQETDLGKALITAQLLSPLFTSLALPPLSGSFWAEVCAKLSLIPNIDHYAAAFRQKYHTAPYVHSAQLNVRSIETALLSYLGTPWPIHDFEDEIDDLTLRDILCIFSKVNPVRAELLNYEYVGFRLDLTEAIRAEYRLSTLEAATLFFDFLSVEDIQEIRMSLELLSYMESITRVPFEKKTAIQWMHFRPSHIEGKNILGVQKAPPDLGPSVQSAQAGEGGELPDITMLHLIERYVKLRKKMIEEHLGDFVLPRAVFDELDFLSAYFACPSSRSAQSNSPLCEDFQQSCLEISFQLASVILPLSAQPWTDSISEKGLSVYHEDRVSQHMYKFSSLKSFLPQAIYRAWSIPTQDSDHLQFELSVVDTSLASSRNLRTYHINAPLKLTAEQRDPVFMKLLHKAVVVMGEEKLDPTVDPDATKANLVRFAALKKKFPEVGQYNALLKTNINMGIQEIVKRRPDIHPSLLEFEILLLLYPAFAKEWDAYAPVNMAKETAGIALFEFVKKIKLEFRKATIDLGGALPSSLENLHGKESRHLAAFGNIYPLANGLSLLPEAPIYRTGKSLKDFAIQEELDEEIRKLAHLMHLSQSSEEESALAGKFYFSKDKLVGEIRFEFHPLPQGDEKVPLNELKFTLRLSHHPSNLIHHIVRYGKEVKKADSLPRLLKWHLLGLMAKGHAEILRIENSR